MANVFSRAGNTLIQKVRRPASDHLALLADPNFRPQIFERASPEARMALLERIAPHLASIG